MRETLIAFGLLALLIVSSIAIQASDPMKVLYAGALLVAGGLAFSTPCAVVYHWQLYRALGPRGRLDKRWLLNPTAHHDRLEESDLPRVMPWFYAGAFGWVVAVLGCVLLGIAAYLSRS